MKVPSNWVKVNSTKKTIRYHPPEVVTALDQLSLVTEELIHICRAAWDSFLKEFGRHYSEFQAACEALASLDCLQSLAILSRNKVIVLQSSGLLNLNSFLHYLIVYFLGCRVTFVQFSWMIMILFRYLSVLVVTQYVKLQADPPVFSAFSFISYITYLKFSLFGCY